MFGMRFLWRLCIVASLWVGVGMLTQGCSVTSTPPAGAFSCKTDFDCLADQICTAGKCINQINRPDASPPPPPPPDTAPPPDTTPPPPDTTPPPPPDTTPPPPDTTPPPPPDTEPPPDQPRVCGPGTRAPCYDGPSGTGGIGACKRGTQTCNDQGQWGPCEGQVLPTPEGCDDGVDNDCDGEVDEGCNACPDGAIRTCYSGPSSTRSIGECQNGSQRCLNGQWGACEGEITPVSEICDDNKDNDCDGRTDEDCGTGSCTEGTQRPCYSGLKGCEATPSGSYVCKGVCKAGFQKCVNGKWDACVGDAKDSPERCDSQDNDCDGNIDNNPVDAGQTCTFPNAQGICAAGKTACVNGKLSCQQVNQPVPEKCDNMLDDDCDGQTDEGCMGSVVILTSITPDKTPRAQNFDATLAGTGFQAGAAVEISPANQPTPTYQNISSYTGKVTSVTSTQMKIEFRPISALLKEGTYMVRVVNPGNNPSNAVFLTLTPSTTGNGPTITSLTPSVANVGQAYSGTFKGTGYNVGATVEIRAPIIGQWVKLSLLGSAVTINRVDSTTLTISFSSTPGSFNGISLKGDHDVRIVNTDGTFSNTVKITIQ